MDTTQPPLLDPDAPTPDDSVPEISASASAADDAIVPELLTALESVDPAAAPDVAERLATVLSDELEG